MQPVDHGSAVAKRGLLLNLSPTAPEKSAMALGTTTLRSQHREEPHAEAGGHVFKLDSTS
jgi:hypothetical protein